MAANNTLRITDINYDTIRQNLKNYLSNQTEFLDYDFDSSTMAVLLNLLAYNTYYNSFYLSMVGNEMFLPSAQLRDSVVLKSKLLNYTPRSAKGATAGLNVVVNPTNNPAYVTINSNTLFSTAIDGISYTFSTPQAYTLSQNGSSFFGNISIVEGTPLQHRFTVNTLSPSRYIIPNQNIDTSSLNVRIQESNSNTTINTYKLATDLSSVNSVSKIYFLQEVTDKKYEVYFGDGVFGKTPSDGNIVIIDYKVVNGEAVNGANTFSAVSTLGGHSSFTITTSDSAQGGAPQESVESIKFNAPNKFQSQDRLVTINDYKTKILSENGDLQSLSVWGGEENTPPVYGKVYISAKPTSGAIISTQRKELIKSQIKSKNIVPIDVEFVDASFLYIIPDIKVRYDPDLTSLTASELNERIQTALIEFETSNLGAFNNKFYLSKLLSKINISNPSFISVDCDIKLQKRFIPVTSQITKYTINFNNAIKHPESLQHIPHEGSHFISSSQFTFGNYSMAQFDDDGENILRIFNKLPTSQLYVKQNAGSVNYDSGLIVIDNLIINAFSGDYLAINMVPVEKNIFGIRNQILLISDSKITTINDQTGAITSSVTNVPTAGVTTTNITENGINSIIV